MDFDFVFAADVLSSLGLLIVLGLVYAWGYRALDFPRVNQIILGVMFGLVAAAEMYRPLEPMEGLIIDLRIVPIALAGAFLGWRGALACIAVAISVRAGIGGVGMWPGIAAIAISASAGLLWAHLTRNTPKRRIEHVMFLGAMASTSLAAGLLLPPQEQAWFFGKAALPLWALYMVTIPVVALIIESQRRTIDKELTLKASTRIDPENGLLTAPVFRRECLIRATASADGSYTQAALIRVGGDLWAFGTSDDPSRRRLLAAIRLRLREHFPHCRLAGAYENNVLLVPLLQEHMIDVLDFAQAIYRIVSEAPFLLTDGIKHTPSISVHIIDVADNTAFSRALSRRARRVSRPVKRLPQPGNDAVEPVLGLKLARQTMEELNEQGLEQMFHKADFLMNHGARQRRTG